MRKTIGAALAALTLGAGAIVGPSTPAFATDWITGEDLPGPCYYGNPTGPNGWQWGRSACTAPMQANDKMQRIRVLLTDETGFIQEWRIGNWVECNNNNSDSDAFLPANWANAIVFIDYVNDTKPGGC